MDINIRILPSSHSVGYIIWPINGRTKDNEEPDSRENTLLLSADVDLDLNVPPYFSQVG